MLSAVHLTQNNIPSTLMKTTTCAARFVQDCELVFSVLPRTAIVTSTITATVYALYTEPETHHLDFERWQASEVYIYKGRGTTVGHEFFVATFPRCGNRGISALLFTGYKHFDQRRLEEGRKCKNCFQLRCVPAVFHRQLLRP
jgi:hypothetical protein